MKEITVDVEGMICGMCECHVNDAVRRACAVKKVTSSHSKNKTVIIAEENIDIQAIIDAITTQGYKVGSVTARHYEKRGFFGRNK